MYRFAWTVCWSCVAAAAFGQPMPKPKEAPPEPGFLMEALNHASPAIRLRAAGRLADRDVAATPLLVDAVLRSDDLPAVRAAVVLIDRLSSLPKGKLIVGPRRVSLSLDERQQVRRLMSIVKGPAAGQPGAEPWRWYLAVFVLDKLDPASLPELLPDLRAALQPGQAPMKQYAAVQALFRLGPAGHAAEDDLWALLESRPCLQGLYVTRRALDDDAVAFTDEIGVYSLVLGLESSYATADLFVLETLRRVGAASDRLTGALAHLARHESQDVRLDVARQLGLLDDAAKPVAAEVLIHLLYEPGSLLRAMLGEENAELRDEAIGLFTRLGPAAVSTVPVLAELLAAKENRLRFSAAVTLGRIGPAAADALPALRLALRFEQLREGDDYQAMAEAIDRITGKAKDKPKPGAK